jgi:formylmethionine deformylase/peptide deformylase
VEQFSFLKDPDPVLRQVSKPVEFVDDKFKNYMLSLRAFLFNENARGGGIAAIQVGHPLRAYVVDIPIYNEAGEIMPERKPFFIINPEIIFVSPEQVVLSEGCFSVRGDDGIECIRGEVERPISVAINYTDLEGKRAELFVDGTKSRHDLWTARCIQHEIDHLNGILFIDKLYKASAF